MAEPEEIEELSAEDLVDLARSGEPKPTGGLTPKQIVDEALGW